MAFILWSLMCCHFLSLGLLLAATMFLVFMPLPNLPKIGRHEFDQWQFFLVCGFEDCKVRVSGDGMHDHIIKAEV